MAFSLNQPFTLLSTLLLLLLLNSSLCESFHGFSRYGARISGDGSSRHLLESRNTQHPNNCGELVAQSQCSRNSKCSWCTSEDLDDMCFSKSEAWRLPQQVYSCALIRHVKLISSHASVILRNTSIVSVNKDQCRSPNRAFLSEGEEKIADELDFPCNQLSKVICEIFSATGNYNSNPTDEHKRCSLPS
ncbi:hypothetical protein ACSQ67_012902 [Phaseolus vulgaris]